MSLKSQKTPRKRGFLQSQVAARGLEPRRLAAPDPKSGASANFAKRPVREVVPPRRASYRSERVSASSPNRLGPIPPLALSMLETSRERHGVPGRVRPGEAEHPQERSGPRSSGNSLPNGDARVEFRTGCRPLRPCLKFRRDDGGARRRRSPQPGSTTKIFPREVSS